MLLYTVHDFLLYCINYIYIFPEIFLHQDPDHIIDTPDLGLSFHDFAHPAVFVGTGIMLLCLIPVIFSYICCHR